MLEASESAIVQAQGATYRGGAVTIVLSASDEITYVLLGGEDCVLYGPGTTVLTRGSIRTGSVSWAPPTPTVQRLCLQLINPHFVDWDHVNPVAYNVTISENQGHAP